MSPIQDYLAKEMCKQNLMDGWIWTGIEEQIYLCRPEDYLVFDAVKYKIKNTDEWTDWITDSEIAKQTYIQNVTKKDFLNHLRSKI